jgi:hypothetical protein
MRRIMLLVVVALVMAAMLAMGAGPVLAHGNPGCGAYGTGEYASENEPGTMGENISAGAPHGGMAGTSGAKICSISHPSP